MPDDLRERIADVRRLRDAASPLPWLHDERIRCAGIYSGPKNDCFDMVQGFIAFKGSAHDDDSRVNWEYMTTAANLAPALADAYDAAQATIALMESRELEELHRLRKMVSRDLVAPCSCCGTMLSWQFAGDGTNCLEVATGLDHKCKFDIQSAPPGTYRHLERQIAERDAEIATLREALSPFASQAVATIVKLRAELRDALKGANTA